MLGVYTLEDLIVSDESILCRHGFTLLMARRLYNALDEYIMEPELTPFELLHQNQQPQTNPSTLLRSRENYGKRNIKRQSVKQNNQKQLPGTPPTPRRQQSTNSPRILGEGYSQASNSKNDITAMQQDVSNKTYQDPISTGQVTVGDNRPFLKEEKLLSEAKKEETVVVKKEEVRNLPEAEKKGLGVNSGLKETISLNDIEINLPEANERGVEQHYMNFPQTGEDETDSLNAIETLPEANEEHHYINFPLTIDDGNDEFSFPGFENAFQENPVLERHLSMPNGLHFSDTNNSSALWMVAQYRGRSYSCPVLSYEDTYATSIENETYDDALATLRNPNPDRIEVVSSLYSFIELCKTGWKGDSIEIIQLVEKTLSNHSIDVEIVELSCHIFKYITYNLVNVENLSHAVELNSAVHSIYEAVELHTFSRKVQLNGCIALSNILRSGELVQTCLHVKHSYNTSNYMNIILFSPLVPSLSIGLASNEVLATLSSSLQQYQKDEAVILGVLSVLVTILSLGMFLFWN